MDPDRLPLKAAILLLALYLVFSLLQATSYPKIFPEGTIWDGVTSSILFAAILFPASYMGTRISPARLPLISRFFVGNHRGTAPSRVLLGALTLAVVALILNVSLSIIFSWAWVEPTSQSYVANLTLAEKIGASVSAGIWEETIFRLFLISALLVFIKNKIVSVILANLLFTLMHLVFQSPPYNAPALIIVFSIGLLYSKCYVDNGLESAAICHAGMNFLVMILGSLLG